MACARVRAAPIATDDTKESADRGGSDMPGRRRDLPEERRPPREEATSRARLEDRTRVELYELARKLGIAGRSEMSRAELLEAIRRR
jgi:hypothetical protein